MSNTAVPPNSCVIHGSHGMPYCPRCVTAVMQPTTVPMTVPARSPVDDIPMWAKEAKELIADLKNALARERGGGSPLDRMSYILLNDMARDFLASPVPISVWDFDEQEDDDFYTEATRGGEVPE